MFFNSAQYFFFFILIMAVFCPLTKLTDGTKRRGLSMLNMLFLLAASYFFYMQWNAKYALLILAVTAVTYFAALALDRLRLRETAETGKRAVMALTIAVCIGLLIYFKYANFFIDNINAALTALRSGKRFSPVEVLLPVGISFYVFQALGYVIDVYRGKIAAEKNPFLYALFISFFPQLVAGPIERSSNLLVQLRRPKPLTGRRLSEGLILILFGLWQKIVVADNIARIVDPVFNGWQRFEGVTIVISAMLFGIQIYCDFDGYSNIAIGSARILGIDLMKNFRAPYLAVSVPDFWSRWHISLTSWFRDYLYIPLGGNRKGALRKNTNTLIVFLVSGAWHGAAWNYIVWGLLNGAAMVGSKLRRRAAALSRAERLGKRLCTFVIISFTWLFFRADSVTAAFQMIRRSLIFPGLKNLLSLNVINILSEGGGVILLFVVAFAIAILFLRDTIEEHTGDFTAYLLNQKAIYRWGFYSLLIFMVIIFGVYGDGYEQTQFIYFQF